MNYKGVDFEKRLSCVEEADKLLSELKTCQVNADSTADQLWEIRTACDRILRACNTQLGKSRSCPLLFQRILLIAELACQGYTAAVTQRTSLYLEKILFYFMKNVAAQDAYDECSKFADLLYSLLGSCKLSEEHVKDYVAIAKSCFGILWKGADGVAKSGQWTLLESRTALCCRFRAVRFLVLLEAKDLVSSPGELSSSVSQTSRHAVAAVAIFEAQRTPFANEDVLFLSDQMFCLLIRPLMEVICRPDQMTAQQALCLIDLTVERCRRLCKRDCIREAQEAIKQSQLYLAQVGFNEALELCQLGVALQQASSSSPLLQQATEAICRFMESNGGRWEFLTESTQFFVSVIDRRSKRTEGAGFALTDFLYLWAFLEQRAKLLNKQKARVPTDCLKQQRNLKVQLYSCYQLYTAVIFKFFQNAQDLKPVVLVDLLKTCTDTVNRMLDELDGFSAKDQTEYFNVTALCAFNLAYGFYNQKMYSESSDIMGILCERFCSAAPVQDCMPFEKLHKYFRIQAESCRKAGFFQKASRVIALWLTALKEKITEELEDPVSLWVRVKMDALKGGDEDLRLKTLKDCLADSNVKPLEPSILVILLSEELKAYRTVHADTGQERYNVICDLLEICSEESELLHERAVYLVELAKVLCYHDYCNQADCSALDSVQEALRLLEALPKTPGNTEQLMDDQAHALLWLFICTIESKMQASMAKEQYTGNNQAQVKKYLQVFEPNDLNYEDKLQEDKFTYAGIDFNLVADSGFSMQFFTICAWLQLIFAFSMTMYWLFF